MIAFVFPPIFNPNREFVYARKFRPNRRYLQSLHFYWSLVASLARWVLSEFNICGISKNFEYRGIPFPRDLWWEIWRLFQRFVTGKAGIWKCATNWIGPESGIWEGTAKLEVSRLMTRNLRQLVLPRLWLGYLVIKRICVKLWVWSGIGGQLGISNVSWQSIPGSFWFPWMPRNSKFFEILQTLTSERAHLVRLATGDQWKWGDWRSPRFGQNYN